MQKIQRNYRIEFEIGTKPYKLSTEYNVEEYLTVEYPFTFNFQINRENFLRSNSGHFQLVNLSPTTQAKLWLDINEGKKYIKMKVYAGYQETMPLIFDGLVSQCYSYRRGGDTQVVTDIEANDAQFLYEYGFANYTFNKGTSAKNMLETLLYDVPTIKLGYISSDLSELKSNQTFLGSTVDLIKREYLDFNVFIDKGELNILNENDVIPGQITVLTSESGLLGSPMRSDTNVIVQIIFEPFLVVGQAIEILSTYYPQFNNRYKIIKIKHEGTISGTQSGDLTTTLTLSLGSKFNELTKQIEKFNKKDEAINFQKPTSTGSITSPYGWRTHPITKEKRFHNGIDIGVNLNTEVKAIANGTISFCGTKGGYGYAIIINHGDVNGSNITSLYGHLNSFKVSNGQTVSKGEIIALSGGVGKNAGKSTGPHLHLEIKENNKSVNPSKYIGTY